MQKTLHRLLEDRGHRYIHNSAQFFTTLVSTRFFMLVLIPTEVMEFDILSFLYCKTSREYKKPKYKIGDKVRIQMYVSPKKKNCKL